MSEVRTYRRTLSTWWWVRKPSYFVFVMRELSSIFVAWFVLVLLVLLAAIGRSEEAYRDVLDIVAHPVVVAVDAVAFAFVLLHTITWFALTPKAMDARVAGRRVPASAVIASQYVGLAVVSAFVVWVVTA
jgi:fumarate reductase subunit C